MDDVTGAGADSPGDVWTLGWRSAVDLRSALLGGAGLPELPFVPVRLEPGETAHAELVLDYRRFYGTDVSYSQTSGFYFGSPVFVAASLAGQGLGNMAAKNRAEAQARAQWREHQRVTAYLTDTRLLALVDGHRWLSWWHAGAMQVHTLLEEWSVVQMFGDTEPLRWEGPAAPWLAVALVDLVYGRDALARHPGLAALAVPGG
ncbi:hypothetical protein [Nocardiopsis coralliicola]